MTNNLYTSGKLKNVSDHGPFSKTLEVYGLELAGLKEIGGNSEVENEFIKKVAQTVKMLLDPNGENIDLESVEIWIDDINMTSYTNISTNHLILDPPKLFKEAAEKVGYKKEDAVIFKIGEIKKLDELIN